MLNKGELKTATDNIARELLLTIGDLHRDTGREVPVPDKTIRDTLGRLVSIHAEVKKLAVVMGSVDDLLANLGASLKAPATGTENGESATEA